MSSRKTSSSTSKTSTSSANLKEQNANSLLHSSVVKANKSTLLEAIKLGCNINSQSKYGDPPIVAAAGIDPYTTHDSKTGKDKVIEIFNIILEQERSDVNIRGNDGETALHRSVVARAANRMKYLIEHKCDVDIRDSRGQTAVFFAISYSEGLEILMSSNALLDGYDLDGFTPLMHAMMSESPQSLNSLIKLIKGGAFINCLCPKDKKSTLMVTLREDESIPRSDQRVEKSIALLDGGIDVNHQDSRGKTALHYAVASECVDLAQVLIKYKAGVDLKDAAGQTPCDLAQASKNADILRLIERAADKTSRLVPYQDSLSHLEKLIHDIELDDELSADQRVAVRAQVATLEKTLQELIAEGHGADVMLVEHKRVLKKYFNELCDEMMPLYIVPFLHKASIITKADMSEITNANARKTMCIKLLEILPHRGSKGFPTLLEALKISKQQRVYDILTEDLK